MSELYSADRTTVGGVEVVQLAHAASATEVAVAIGAGNIAYQFKVRGNHYVWFPFPGPAELLEHPRTCGVPFLAPWANRLDGDSYWVNGKQYTLNASLANFHRDSNGKPIHGLLRYSRDWELVSAEADAASAQVTSRLDFGLHPDLMAQFPLAHTIFMTYRLSGARLEVETVLQNQAAGPLPVAIGYHPYFQLNDTPRDQWKVHLAARSHLALNEQLIPTGERKPIEFRDPHLLQDGPLDDVFSDLIRGTDGRARFRVQGREQSITVSYGPKYPVAVVFAPPGQNFICFEPMTAVTDAFNLAHAGVFPGLQSVPVGGEWRESFWIEVQAP